MRAAGLVTTDGKTTSAHRFRHTVEPNLLGVEPVEDYPENFRHESAACRMVYIGLTDEEVRQDYQTVLGPGAIIAGPGAGLVRSGV